MLHGTFYGVILISFLIGIGVQWYFREYFQLLVFGHSVEILFMMVLTPQIGSVIHLLQVLDHR